MITRAHICGWLTMILMMGAGVMNAQETNYKGYTLFIYNFMKYVEWPEAQSTGDFTLAVVGDSPINKELEMLAATKKLKGRSIVFRRYNTAEEALQAHLVFVPASKSSVVKLLREQTKGRPLLIVGEREGLARKGAAISFVTLEDDALKFDINRQALEQNNLRAASQLVSLGIPVN
jgi:hypothetical protein